MSKRKKYGNLTKIEIHYIDTHESSSAEELAEDLNRTVKKIQEYRDSKLSSPVAVSTRQEDSYLVGTFAQEDRKNLSGKTKVRAKPTFKFEDPGEHRSEETVTPEIQLSKKGVRPADEMIEVKCSRCSRVDKVRSSTMMDGSTLYVCPSCVGLR